MKQNSELPQPLQTSTKIITKEKQNVFKKFNVNIKKNYRNLAPVLLKIPNSSSCELKANMSAQLTPQTSQNQALKKSMLRQDFSTNELLIKNEPKWKTKPINITNENIPNSIRLTDSNFLQNP